VALQVLAVVPAEAQDVGRAQGLSAAFDSTLAVIDIRNSPSRAGQDTVLQAQPSVQYTSRAGWIRGSGRYGVGFIQHSRDGGASDVQHNLNAQFTAEAVPNRVFVEAAATAARSSLSPFGLQTAQGSLQTNENRVDVGTLSLTPFVRGAVGDIATYEARLSARAQNTRHSKLGDSTGVSRLASLGSPSGRLLGWSLSYSEDHSAFRDQRSTDTRRAQASLTWVPDPELRFIVRGGRESSNVGSLEAQSVTSRGGEIQWTPSDRTQVRLAADRRYFGTSRQLTISERLPLSSVVFTSTRDVVTNGSPTGVGQPITLYQLYFQLYASAVPDPVVREQFVLTVLQSLGLDPSSAATGGAVRSSATLSRRSDLAWTYGGRRLTVTVQGFSSTSDRVSADPSLAGDGRVAQTGYTSTVAWRLTPTAALNVSGQRLMTQANATQAGTDLKSLGVNWTDTLSPRTTVGLGARYAVFNSTIDPYRETGITASLNHRF
jgi:uncharacterized protein (PEP-CTERM system associated)